MTDDERADALVTLRAAEYAREKHGAQVDKCGAPYMGHVSRVAAYTGMLRAGHGDVRDCVQVAWLHDVVEDTDVTLDDLRADGFSEIVVHGVDAMTRRGGESNREYVLRVAANPLAATVKRADYLDNMDPSRMALIPSRSEALGLLRVMADSHYILGKALLDAANAEANNEC